MTDYAPRDCPGHSTQPAVDVYEYTLGAGTVDLSALGGPPVRSIVIVDAGSGQLLVKTRNSRDTYRTLTGLASGDTLGEPLEITVIGGTTAGSNVTKIRVFK